MFNVSQAVVKPRETSFVSTEDIGSILYPSSFFPPACSIAGVAVLLVFQPVFLMMGKRFTIIPELFCWEIET